jgi:hypothetical protein
MHTSSGKYFPFFTPKAPKELCRCSNECLPYRKMKSERKANKFPSDKESILLELILSVGFWVPMKSEGRLPVENKTKFYNST